MSLVSLKALAMQIEKEKGVYKRLLPTDVSGCYKGGPTQKEKPEGYSLYLSSVSTS